MQLKWEATLSIIVELTIMQDAKTIKSTWQFDDVYKNSNPASILYKSI